MIKIILFESYYYLFHGNSKYITLLAKHLNYKKYQLLVVMAGNGPLQDELHNQKIETDIVPYPSSLDHFGRSLVKKSWLQHIHTLIGLFQYNLLWYRYLKNKDYNIVHCTSVRSLLSVGFGAKLARKKLSLVIQMEYRIPILDTIGLLMADKIIFISETLKSTINQYIFNMIHHKTVVIPFGIDLKDKLLEHHHHYDLLKIPDGSFVIGTMASIVPQKGLNFLIDAIKLLMDQGTKNIICCIIGGTPKHMKAYEIELHKQVEKLGLEDKILFLGWQRNSIKFLKKMDVFVLPSLSEGLSRATVEAMWMGKPVIVTDTGAMKDLVDDSVGRLIPKSDIDALAAAINYFQKNPDAMMMCGEKARKRVIEQYSIENHIHKMREYFSDMSYL